MLIFNHFSIVFSWKGSWLFNKLLWKMFRIPGTHVFRGRTQVTYYVMSRTWRPPKKGQIFELNLFTYMGQVPSPGILYYFSARPVSKTTTTISLFPSPPSPRPSLRVASSRLAIICFLLVLAIISKLAIIYIFMATMPTLIEMVSGLGYFWNTAD